MHDFVLTIYTSTMLAGSCSRCGYISYCWVFVGRRFTRQLAMMCRPSSGLGLVYRAAFCSSMYTEWMPSAHLVPSWHSWVSSAPTWCDDFRQLDLKPRNLTEVFYLFLKKICAFLCIRTRDLMSMNSKKTIVSRVNYSYISSFFHFLRQWLYVVTTCEIELARTIYTILAWEHHGPTFPFYYIIKQNSASFIPARTFGL
jgi:hypothetical protein